MVAESEGCRTAFVFDPLVVLDHESFTFFGDDRWLPTRCNSKVDSTLRAQNFPLFSPWLVHFDRVAALQRPTTDRPDLIRTRSSSDSLRLTPVRVVGPLDLLHVFADRSAGFSQGEETEHE